jgi:hypothetical protein
MPFTTLCLKKRWSIKVIRAWYACIFLFIAGIAQGQAITEITDFRIEKTDEQIQTSANITFELPSAVEDTLLKGVPLYFVFEVEILRERWYWYDRRVSAVQRHIRLAYQPLTRRWRLNITTGLGRQDNPGLALNQSFDTLAQALAVVKRVSAWKIADTFDIDPSIQYRLEFRFRLDLSQLPLPFQIGTMGQSDWNISAKASYPLYLGAGK